jgi:hypothetical protein
VFTKSSMTGDLGREIVYIFVFGRRTNMITPEDFTRVYAKMFTRFWNGSDWVARQAPIVNYLQHNDSQQAKNATAAERAFRNLLPGATGIPNVNHANSFNYNDYDYINNSITRCFIGKASPWEIQETLQLASAVGAVTESELMGYCRTKLGVDCGGFVANYWGEACPHMVRVAPPGWNGILPRGFWSNTQLFPDVISRRRQEVSHVHPGDAAIFFEGVKDSNPDIAAIPDGHGGYKSGSGSKAFHIGLVNSVNYVDDQFTSLEIAESSGSPSTYGGTGVNVRPSKIMSTGKSGRWVHCRSSEDEWIYFVGPPDGWGPETGYNIA